MNMRLIITEQEKKDILSSYVLIENVKQAKKYVELGLLSKDILEKLLSFDPSKTNKYVGWMAKIWMNEQPDLDQLKNTVEEYDVFLNKGKVKTRDINLFKTFKDLQSELDILNQYGEGISNKDLKSDYDIVTDNQDLLIMSPHTHEASRKLGFSHFAFRPNISITDNSSQWCTTYKNSSHFNCFYHAKNQTFYYIKVKSEQLIEKLKKSFPIEWKRLIVVALVLVDDEQIEGYDAENYKMSEADIKTFLSVIKLNNDILVPRRSTGKRELSFKTIHQKNIQEYIKNGSKGDLQFTDVNTLGNLTSVDGTVDDGINAVWNVYATIGFPCKSEPPEVVVTPVVTIAGSEGPHPL